MIKRDYFISARIYEDDNTPSFSYNNFTMQYISWRSRSHYIYDKHLAALKKEHGEFKKVEIVSFNRI